MELAGLYESLGRLCLDLRCSVIKQGVLNPMLIKANDTSRTIEGGTMLMLHLSQSIDINLPQVFHLPVWVFPPTSQGYIYIFFKRFGICAEFLITEEDSGASVFLNH